MTAHDFAARLRRALALPAPASSDYDLNPDAALPGGRILRPAAVLVAVTEQLGVPWLFLTKRSSRLEHHPGQIAFPGGKLDESDADAAGAALREAWEEIALPPSAVEVVGCLPRHETVTGYDVVPVVAQIHERFHPVPEAGEVDEIFLVPFHHVLDPARFRVESRRWRGRRRHYYTVPYGPHYIWGATARILRGLAERWDRAA